MHRLFTWCVMAVMALTVLFIVPRASAQTDDDTEAQLMEALLEVAGPDWDGNPCSLTLEQRQEIDRRASDLGINLGFSEIDCDPDDIDIPTDDVDPILSRFIEVIVEVTGREPEGDPCDLTAGERAEINRRMIDEFGDAAPILYCPGDSCPCDCPLDDDETIGQVMEVIEGIVGSDWDGNPCSLTLEQREAIDERLQEEFGLNFGFADIQCEGPIAGGNPVVNRIREYYHETRTSGVDGSTAVVLTTLYPNPATNRLTAHLTRPTKSTTVLIYTSSGRTAMSISVPDGQTEISIDLSTLPTGAYYLSARSSTATTQIMPFVIER